MTNKPLIIGKNIYLREVKASDAGFILSLRTNEALNQHISATDSDMSKQIEFIEQYKNNFQDFYFVICSKQHESLGVVRIYDIQDSSFCWGSWIIKPDAPITTAIESALLVYDFAFFSLHYKKSHFDVRKQNSKVISFHEKMGAVKTHEDELNFYYDYSFEQYLIARKKYKKFIENPL